MRKLLRLLALFAAVAGFVSMSAPAWSQAPTPSREQIQLFNSLSPADQQALIGQLQGQLSPSQLNTVLGQLTRSPQSAGQTASDANMSVDVAALAADLASGFEETDSEETLGAGDTLIIRIARPEDAEASDDEAAVDAFLERLEDGNPYRLDGAGRLLLPGVPLMELAGLNVEEATIRLGVERELRPFELTLTRLPLEPFGADALEPFGYELFREGGLSLAPVRNIAPPVDYVIGPGDSLTVLLRGGDAPGEYLLPVSPEGTINFPVLGPINVSGLSLADARELIDTRVGDQMIGVNASTTLGELRSINVFVLGEVERQGSYNVSSLARISNALIAGGGINEIGSLRNVRLNRAGATVATLDLYDLLLAGDTSSDLRLQQDDTVYVPTVGAAVAIEGEVRRPAIYELRGEQTFFELIALAGGFTANADRNAVKLERIEPGSGTAVSMLDLTAGTDGQGTARDGDVLRVDPNIEQLAGSVRLEGNVQRPGLYPWRPGMTVSSLLTGPDLVKPLSDLNYVIIRREARPNVEVDVLSVDLEAVWQRQSGAFDLALQPRDTVYVFHLETGRQQYIRPIIEELEAQAGPNEPVPIVRIGGQVRADGEYPLESGMRISDLLRAGGGLTDAAYAAEAELSRYRIVDGEKRETELVMVDLAAVLAGNVAADVLLDPYDFLSIREVSRFRSQETVTLRGEFVFPGEYPIRQGENLRSVLARAGGLTEFAFPEGSVFTRVSARETELARNEALAQRLQSDLAAVALSDQGGSDALATGKALLDDLRNTEATGRTVIRLDEIISGRSNTSIELQDGDELYVPERRQEVTVIGEVQYQTSHLFEPGLTRADYIERSGGLTQRADKRRIYIVRANGEVVIDSGGRWFRRDVGVEVRPGDTVVAPIDVGRMRPLTFWTSVSQIIYSMAIAAAAVNSF